MVAIKEKNRWGTTAQPTIQNTESAPADEYFHVSLSLICDWNIMPFELLENWAKYRTRIPDEMTYRL